MVAKRLLRDNICRYTISLSLEIRITIYKIALKITRHDCDVIPEHRNVLLNLRYRLHLCFERDRIQYFEYVKHVQNQRINFSPTKYGRMEIGFAISKLSICQTPNSIWHFV